MLNLLVDLVVALTVLAGAPQKAAGPSVCSPCDSATALARAAAQPGPCAVAVPDCDRPCGPAACDRTDCELPDGARLLCCEKVGDGCVGCAERPDGSRYCFECTPDGCEIVAECDECPAPSATVTATPPSRIVAL